MFADQLLPLHPMPICCLGDECKHPTLALCAGHPCIRCGKLANTLCSHVIEDALPNANLICLKCHGTVPTNQGDEGVQDTTGTAASPAATSETEAASAVDVPPPLQEAGKKTPAGKQKQKKKPAVKEKLKKNEKQKAFVLQADSGEADPFVMMPVFFDVSSSYGKQLWNHFGGDKKIAETVTKVQGVRYLEGTIIQCSKGKGNTVSYDVQWKHDILGTTSCDLQVLMPASKLAKKVRAIEEKGVQPPISPDRTFNPESMFNTSSLEALHHIFDSERGEPMGSDIDSDDDKALFFGKPSPDEGNPFLTDHAATEDSDQTFFCWSSGKSMGAPNDLSNCVPTTLKENVSAKFKTPMSSLLSMIPIKIFKSIVYYSNKYAHEVVQKSETGHVCGHIWSEDISLSELMCFFGILIGMVLRPPPG